MVEGEKIAATRPAADSASNLARPEAQIEIKSGNLTPDCYSTPGHRSLFRKVFSFNTLLVFLLLGAVAGTIYLNIKGAAGSTASDTGHSIIEGDTWWHLEVGNHILSAHTWPTKDQYSFTAPGDTWIAYEWVGEVSMAAAYRLAGMTGLTILMVILTAGIVLLMFEYARLRSNNTKAAFVACALMLPLTVVSFTLRPQLLGYVFLLITLICLERFRKGKLKSLWLLPLLMLVWVNTHGTFVFGIVFLGIYYISGLVDLKIGTIRMESWTDWQRRHLGLIGLLSVAALVVTPYGTFLAGRYMEMSFSQPLNLASFQEWVSPNFGQFYGMLFLAMILLFLLAPFLNRLEYRVEEVALIVVGIFAACIHLRFLILFAILFCPFLATLVVRYTLPYDESKDRPLVNLALIGIIAFGCVRLFPSRSTLQKMVSHEFPVEAVNYVRQHPALEPMYNEEFWGGYLIKRLWPQQRVFIDGRADLYEPAGVLSDYISIMSVPPDTPFLLRKYHVRSCLIKTDSPLATLLTQLPGWKRVYSDSISVIFVRRTRTEADSVEKRMAGRKT